MGERVGKGEVDERLEHDVDIDHDVAGEVDTDKFGGIIDDGLIVLGESD